MTERVPPRREAWRGRLAIAALVAASLVPLWAGANASRLLGDDAFITLTYARSLAAGEGLTYQGREVLATTTPLSALLVGGLARVLPGRMPPDLAVWLGATAWLATGWVLYLGRRAWRLPDHVALALALMALVGGWTHALGMEAHLFALLLVLACTLALFGRPFRAGVACGLAFLARGEAALLLPLVLAVAAAGLDGEARATGPALRRAGRALLGWLVVLGPWSLYAVRTYGSPLPATLPAKLAQASSGLWQGFAADLVGRWMPYWAASWGPEHPAWANPVWWLVSLGLAWVAVRDRSLLLLVAWAAAYFAAYALLRVPSYPWYSLPVLFVLQLLAALGAARLRDVPVARRASRRMADLVAAAAVAFLLAGALLPRLEAVAADRGDARAPSYLGVALWLEANVPPEASVAFVEVGYLGYHAPNPIVDLAGLVTPDVVPDVARGDFAAGFYRHRPDVFLYLSDFDWALRGIVDDPRFAASYERVARLPGPRSAPFEVYRRVGE